jgi:SAM-dependent methyltransferase
MLYEKISDYYDRLFPLRQPMVNCLGSYLTPESFVLDIGCGTASLTQALSEQCRSIIGIDVSKDMILKGRRKYPGLTLLHTDINGLTQTGFDVIYSTGNTVSYFDPTGLQALAASIAERLSPNGLWIYQTVNWDYLLNRQTWQFQDISFDGGVFRRSYRFPGNGELVDFHLELTVTDGPTLKETHRLYRLPRQEHIDIHCKAGFKLAESFLSWKKEPWTPDVSGATILEFQKNGG